MTKTKAKKIEMTAKRLEQRRAAARASAAKRRAPDEPEVRMLLEALKGRYPSKNALAKALGMHPFSLTQYERGGKIGAVGAGRIRALAVKVQAEKAEKRTKASATERTILAPEIPESGPSPEDVATMGPGVWAWQRFAPWPERECASSSVPKGENLARSYALVVHGDRATTVPLPAGWGVLAVRILKQLGK